MARTGKPKPPTPQRPNIAPRLLNRQGAASYLSVSVPYVDALRAQGLLRPVTLPAARGDGKLRIPLFDVHDLDALVDKTKTTGGVS